MKTDNRGILTSSQREEYLRYEVYELDISWIPDHPLKVVLLIIIFSLMAGSFGYSLRQDPVVIEKLVPVSTCEPIGSLTHKHNYRGMVMQLAAAVPETALRARK